MSTTIETLNDYANRLDYAVADLVNGYLPVEVPVQSGEGSGSVTVYTRTYDDGEMFEAMVAGFIPTEKHQQSEHKANFMFYLLHTAWNTKFGTPEVDMDGEIRFLVEIPLLDAELTLRQFEHVLKVTAATALKMSAEGPGVLETGELPFEKKEQASGDESARIGATLAMMAMSAEGRAKVEALIAEADTPDALRRIARQVLELARSNDAVPDTL